MKYLFTVPGVQLFLSRRLYQDPMEKFFSCQRQIGRTQDNTTVNDFEKNTQALRIADSFCQASVKSNCRGNEELNSKMYSLPKRKRAKTMTRWKYVNMSIHTLIKSMPCVHVGTNNESLTTPPTTTTTSVTNFDLSGITITATGNHDQTTVFN